MHFRRRTLRSRGGFSAAVLAWMFMAGCSSPNRGSSDRDAALDHDGGPVDAAADGHVDAASTVGDAGLDGAVGDATAADGGGDGGGPNCPDYYPGYSIERCLSTARNPVAVGDHGLSCDQCVPVTPLNEGICLQPTGSCTMPCVTDADCPTDPWGNPLMCRYVTDDCYCLHVN